MERARAALTFHVGLLLALTPLAWSTPALGDAIQDAARSGNLPAVQALLKGNPGLVSSKDESGETPLHWAAMDGQTDVARLLLAAKASVSARDNLGATPLHRASDRGYQDLAALLLVNGAEVDARDNDGWTPLHYAARGGREDVVRLLLSRNADINAKDHSGRTPLHYAQENGRAAVVQLLRDHGAQDPPVPPSTPPPGEPSTAAGTDGAQQKTPSPADESGAASEELRTQAETYKLRRRGGSVLILKGPLPQLANLTDQTLAEIAAGGEDWALASYTNDEDQNLRCLAAGRIQDLAILVGTADASCNRGSRMQDIVRLRKLLAESGVLQGPVWISLRVERTSQGYVGSTSPSRVGGELVEIAVTAPAPSTAPPGLPRATCLQNGVPVSEWAPALPGPALATHSWATNFPGTVSEDVDFIPASVDLTDVVVGVAESEHYSRPQIRLALARVAIRDPDRDIWENALLKLREGRTGSEDERHYVTALLSAADQDEADVVRLLLSCSANVNAGDGDGETPLHYAAKKGYKDILELLLANKADVNARDHNGMTALSYAEAGGKKEIVDLLKQHGGSE